MKDRVKLSCVVFLSLAREKKTCSSHQVIKSFSISGRCKVLPARELVQEVGQVSGKRSFFAEKSVIAI